MTAVESSVANWFETSLTSSVGAADLTFNVGSTGTLTSPSLIVIDPRSETKREVIRADGTWGATSFVASALSQRGLAGSASGAQAHDPGTKVVVVPLAQHIEDLHDRIDDLPTLAENDAAYAPLTHASRHANGGADEITVEGLGTAATDTALVLKPDGTGGVAFGTASASSAQDLLAPAGGMAAASGSPSLGVLYTWPAWMLDAGIDESVTAQFVVPSGWATVNISVWWYHAGSSGDVLLGCAAPSVADGGSVTQGAFTYSTITAPAAGVLRKSTLLSGHAVTAGAVLKVEAYRDADNAADTLASDIAVAVIQVTKAS